MGREPNESSGRYSPSVRHGDSMSILQDLVEHSVDDDYYVASQRPKPASRLERGGRRLLAGSAVAAFALMIVVAAIQTYEQRPQTELEREALIERIHEREDAIGGLRDRVETARDRVESLQAGASDPDYDERVVDESIAVGTVPVTGPGARVAVDNAEDFESESQGRIRDTDLQQLVNGLWAAGAEAVAINGQRITSMTSIRTAGDAITVNYRSLSTPYTVDAVGDMNTLAARFLETQAGTHWSTLSNNYGVEFEVSSRSEVSLPAAPKGRVAVRHAEVKGNGQ